ncbi:hypothetical protein ACIBF6_36560 [Streptosporangium amethystogenes]|uniref:hypothetical protein n=1 Tax=Streptosporangium amethystogenes TaxID=2002 RepID=UPI003790D197
MSQANRDAPTSHARRRFIRAAGMALGGGTAALGMSGAVPVAAATGTAAAAGSAGMMSAARQVNYSALTESMASLRTVGDAGRAARRLMEWYAAASPAERADIDGALDVLVTLPGAFSSLDVRDRLTLLAEQLTGPQEVKITTAIGLAIAGLSESHTGPGNALAAGRLYARTIRALPAQPVRAPQPQKPSTAPAPCRPQLG